MARPQVELGPSGSGEGPLFFIAPLPDAFHKDLYGRSFHDPGIDAFEPVIIPPYHLVMKLMPGSLLHGWKGLERQSFGSLQSLIAVYRSIYRPSSTPFNRDMDRYFYFVCFGDRRVLLVEWPIAGVHDPVDELRVRLWVVEYMDKVRVVFYVRIVQPFLNSTFKLL